MPTYRINGLIRYWFVHEIEAASEAEACDAVRGLGLEDLDDFNGDMPEIRHAENISSSPLELLAEQAE
jgi:hypothetical protein